MSKSNKGKVDRRNFLKMSAIGAAAAGGAALAAKSVSADVLTVAKSSGYKETELVKTYYLTARF
jgi:anaerobic selenocysteine-containing dehydrogenase